jgi:hypothetical protein
MPARRRRVTISRVSRKAARVVPERPRKPLNRYHFGPHKYPQNLGKSGLSAYISAWAALPDSGRFAGEPAAATTESTV